MSRRKVKAAAVQFKPTDSSKETISQGVRLAERADKREADIICLPEHWLPEKIIPTPVSPLPDLQKIAKQYSVGIVAGAFFESVRGIVRLSSPVIGPDGEVLGRQFKVHLFRTERKYARPGNSYNVFRFNGFSIGILVCYDVDFPEPSRIFALKGAEMIMCPSRIVRWGITPWREYLTVRCLENRIPIVAPNVYAPPYFDGHSTTLSLIENARTKISYPKMKSWDAKGEGIVVQEFDLDFHNRLRRDRFADRRPETYN